MKLKAIIYIDDDGMGATMTIMDDPCSSPNCVHANIRLSPGTLACAVEYLVHGINTQNHGRNWQMVYRREGQEATVSFLQNRMEVSLYDKPSDTMPHLGIQAVMYIQRENVFIDMSNEWGDDLLDDDYARPGLEDIE